MIPYGKQNISKEDIASVLDVLESDFLTQGPVVPRFEKAICQYTGAKYSVAVNSATSALHLACLALGLGESDWLWTSAITFVSSSNCGLYCNAQIDFVDIDPETWNLDLLKLEEKLIKAEKEKKLPKILVAVHLCGLPCNMEGIQKLSVKYGFSVIEDASHAVGGKYQGHPIGQCKFSEITIFSFHPVKNMTTGEGGIAITNNKLLADKMALLRGHGITKDNHLMNREVEDPWYYEQIELGFNYKLTDIQAALGECQLKRLDTFVKRRHVIADIYNSELSNLPIRLPYQDNENYSGMHLYVIRLNINEISRSHSECFHDLREKGIGVNLHYIPVYRHPYYMEMGFDFDHFPEAEAYYAEAISLPMYPDLTNEQQSYVIESLELTINS